MLFHAKALELYTTAFQSLVSMDEEQDIEVFIPSYECKWHNGFKSSQSLLSFGVFLNDNIKLLPFSGFSIYLANPSKILTNSKQTCLLSSQVIFLGEQSMQYLRAKNCRPI